MVCIKNTENIPILLNFKYLTWITNIDHCEKRKLGLLPVGLVNAHISDTTKYSSSPNIIESV